MFFTGGLWKTCHNGIQTLNISHAIYYFFPCPQELLSCKRRKLPVWPWVAASMDLSGINHFLAVGLISGSQTWYAPKWDSNEHTRGQCNYIHLSDWDEQFSNIGGEQCPSLLHWKHWHFKSWFRSQQRWVWSCWSLSAQELQHLGATFLWPRKAQRLRVTLMMHSQTCVSFQTDCLVLVNATISSPRWARESTSVFYTAEGILQKLTLSVRDFCVIAY